MMTNNRHNNLSSSNAAPPLAMAVLLSGSGRTLQNIADEIKAQKLNATITTVISSRENVFGIQRAQKLNLPIHIVLRKQYKTAHEFSEAVWPIIRESQADFVCLAGFLSLIDIPDDFIHRVVNIHPALLPSFGGPGMFGHHVHEAVLANHCKVSGCSVHFCDQSYDTGPVIVQRTCPVLESDDAQTLANRVFEQECIAFPQALKLIAQGRVTVVQGKAVIQS